MNRFEQWALACGLGLVLGCGGESADDEDDGGGDESAETGSIDTGLPEEAPLDSVTPQQYADACERLRASVRSRLGPDRAVRGVCEVYAGALTDDPDQCRSGADTCEANTNAGDPPEPVPSREALDFTTFECGNTDTLEGCSATVGELETCLDDRMSAIEEVLDGNSCENAASVSLATAISLAGVGTTLPPSCSRLEQCPGLGSIIGVPAP
jgi:hypothetical protein